MLPPPATVPEGLTLATPYPSRPEVGASNREIDIYAKRLEFGLWQCNLDKTGIRNWLEEKGYGTHDD
ncbi:hypothetical protein [Marinobacterium stanieri]|uniref:Rz1-like lysis system protein LysC n=1 Tax=Marinobacterium stanieri TaxID=49186 RepID=UPI000255781D|nr:hypothetical protein [Marinobacterium stanieri]